MAITVSSTQVLSLDSGKRVPLDRFWTGMTTLGRQEPNEVPDTTGLGSLTARAATLPASVRHRLLSNAGVAESQLSDEQPVKDTDWGFAAKLPVVQTLLQPTAEQSCQSDNNAGPLESGYLASLRESRTFNCPDCVDAMAEAFGITAAVNQLRGSVASCQLSSESLQATEDKRQLLKSQLRLAWSGEAVKQGVAHAKKAEYDTALGCYKKALELDRRNVDAWVARGAAYANQHAFPKAISDFQTALEIEPGHVNASKYLRVTEQHMVQLGIPVFSSALPWTSEPHRSAEMSMATHPPQPQPPQETGKFIPT
ncbi:hypothetical protein ABBQ38_004032 [Trebouxia sp. C0009 RCD-2024]